MDLALRDGVLVLEQQSGKARVGLHFGGSLIDQVGRAPGNRVEALHLALLTAEVLGQLVDGSLLHGVGLGLDAHQLAAVEGAHVVALAVDLEGGQIGGAEIVAQDALDGLEGPGAGDDDGAAGIKAGAVGGAEVVVGVEQLLHALDGDQALGAVEGVFHGDKGAGLIGGPLGGAAGAEEPGSDVPGGGLVLHGEVLAGSFAVGNQGLEGVEVFLGDNGLVIVHEIAVIRGQGVGVELSVDGGSRDHAGVVGAGNQFGSLHAELGQSAGLNKAGKLVLGKAEDVAAGFNVGDHLGGSVAFADGLNGRVKGDAVRVAGVKVLDLLLGQIDDRVGAPDGDVIGAGQLAAGSGGGFIAALGGSGRVVARRGSGLLSAGSQREDHHKRQKHCKNFLHFSSS